MILRRRHGARSKQPEQMIWRCMVFGWRQIANSVQSEKNECHGPKWTAERLFTQPLSQPRAAFHQPKPTRSSDGQGEMASANWEVSNTRREVAPDLPSTIINALPLKRCASETA